MKRKHILTLAGLAALAGILLVWLFATPTIDVVLSQIRVQETVDRAMPIVGKRGPVEYRIASVQVRLRPDGRIGVRAPVEANVRDHRLTIDFTGAAKPLYQDGKFYLADFEAEAAHFGNMERRQEQDGGARPLVGRLMEKTGLTGETMRKLGTKIDSAAIAAAEQLAVDASTWAFQRALALHPVYTLEGDTVAKAAARITLRDVKVTDDALIVTLDPLGAVLRFIGWIAVAILSILVAIGVLAAGGLGSFAFLLW